MLPLLNFCIKVFARINTFKYLELASLGSLLSSSGDVDANLRLKKNISFSERWMNRQGQTAIF